MIRSIRFVSLSVLAFGMLALGACGDTIEAENKSVESVTERVAKSDIRPSPGRWETQMKMVKMELAGRPPEMRGMMESPLGQVQTSTSCLTKEDAENADGEMFKPANRSGCKYNNFSMGDGKIESDMTCTDEGGTQNMKMAGTYSSDAYAMQATSEGNMGGQKMSMAMEIESKRIGDCDGSEQG